ncbi:MAG: Asp-tRNA(Asn)/Glu-tRNA(Gln) amidotransferase subunit GatA [Pelagibacteraceae bacterium]|jgi:aspartyl-tRNA(Asn)/glutamyl-tRNA(Gln) amidotransferase subunit A|nr:Asp-tRNA(Asn)/Glu-tRNA(Gln) amidotransferase subunit GatA [Pelagibacteraceae bacterium]MBT4952120.1 Asp-tRNA(Asn)/Glu-tRNA(Gln) amidotransferase subunit GatA [Pelagibacteraceae bacterium]MBT6198858.1 Asp-tRNA(Asn)/Glu-tRNA(Gln) amidotransferase subunit GatA [Pelagibacteraceae bacterium]MBT6353525.1 Asp-tRNA(Asn)/Glu-tRNA(Gln) amidotransferase subunit GatA [Pelagibacteraceae bacterium]
MEFQSISQLKLLLDDNKISVKEIAQTYIKKIKEKKDLNIFIYFNEDKIYDQVKLIEKISNDNSLKGIPIAVKDLFCTKNMPTTAGSKILENFNPTYESFVTQKLINQGSMFVGKTNLDEFAMGSATNTSYFGDTINPLSNEGSPLAPGGSSGGSAAAVAADLCLGATGTDTGGSIRQPASFCGVVGIKPTYGICSRWGIAAFASSLDQAGIFSKNVTDASILLKEMAGHDLRDSTSSNVKIPNFSENLNIDLKGKKIGIPKEYTIDGISDEINEVWEQAIKSLEQKGAIIEHISLPHTKYALPTYYIIAPAEASSNLARYDGVKYGHRAENAKSLDDMYELTRSEGFGKEVKRRILIGTYVLSAGYYDAYYLKAQKVRKLIADDFVKAFKECDLILTPTAPSAAFPLNEKQDDPIKMYLNDVFTVPASLAGIPGISIPYGKDKNGLPLGIQLLSKHFNEQEIFNAAFALEKDYE